MANWCNTSYTIEGNQADISALMDKMESLSKRLKPILPNDFGKTWLGNLVHIFGGDVDKINCRGYFQNLDNPCENLLYFDTVTSNEEMTEVWNLVLKSFPSCKCYYYSEECSCQRYVTNDVQGYYYPSRFRLEQGVENMRLMETENEMLSQISSLIGKALASWSEMEVAVRDYNEDLIEENTISANKIVVLDSLLIT